METNVIRLSTLTDQEEVARNFAKYNFLAMPVVDAEDRLVGIVTFDDAMDVMEEEATGGYRDHGRYVPVGEVLSPVLGAGFVPPANPWLMLLMISATFTGMIISGFEDALAARGPDGVHPYAHGYRRAIPVPSPR